MSWMKKYAISCLIAMIVFAAVDARARPGENPREGTIILAGVGWPIVAAIVVGSTIGDIVSGTNQGK